jgi:hypothetical protein
VWKLTFRLSGWNFDKDHMHDSLPGLTWVSGNNRLLLSQSITRFLENPFSDDVFDMQWDSINGGPLSQLSDLDFRFWSAPYVYIVTLLCRLVNYFPRRSSFSSDRFLGPFNITCTFRTVQRCGPPTPRVFQPRDRERRCQTHEIPSWNCKPVILARSGALNCF